MDTRHPSAADLFDDDIATEIGRAGLEASFRTADLAIDAGFDVLPVAVWLKTDGTWGKAPLLARGHLDAHHDKQFIRQQLVTPPHVPASVPPGFTALVGFVPGSGGCGVLDCDIKHGAGGDRAYKALIQQHGPFVGSAWRSPSGGANILWRKPPGATYGNRSPWPGIDVRADMGWVVAPGQLDWVWAGGGYGGALALPTAMTDLLEPAQQHGRRATNAATVRFIEASPTESSFGAMQQFSERLKALAGTTEGSRHEAMKLLVGWAFGMGSLDLRWARSCIQEVWEALMVGEGRLDEVDEMIAWTVGQEIASGKPNAIRAGLAQTPSAPTGKVAPASGVGDYQPSPATNLPDAFWKRPLLADIRRYAHSRQCSADAVYAAVRARFCALTPPRLRVETGVLTPVSLNSLIAIVADSGVGKSAAMALAEEIVPMPGPPASGIPLVYAGPLGSGEGITEAYYEEVTEQNPATGKNERVRKRVRDAALFDMDEGEALTRLSSRNGAILLPELRKAHTGSALGQSNASTLTKRTLNANTYRLALLLGIQPEIATAVLADSAAGTPQRFVFFNGGDPAIPDEPLTVKMPSLPAPPPIITGMTHLISVEPAIAAEIRAQRLAMGRGQLKVPILDSQRPSNRLKEAGILALLDQRQHVNAEDWELADMVMATSDAIRATIVASQVKQAAAQAEHTGNRQAVVENAKDRRLTMDLAERLVAKLRAGPAEGIAKGGLRKTLTSSATRHRFEPAIEQALAEGRVVINGDRLKLP